MPGNEAAAIPANFCAWASLAWPCRYALPRPEGQRCLVVAAEGRTVSRTRSGSLLHTFPSALPGGARGSGGGDGPSSGPCILDCVYHEPAATYFVQVASARWLLQCNRGHHVSERPPGELAKPCILDCFAIPVGTYCPGSLGSWGGLCTQAGQHLVTGRIPTGADCQISQSWPSRPVSSAS